MPATACFRSRPFRKISAGTLLLVSNLAHVRREGVEGLQLAGVRALERDFEIRQERVVVGDFRRAGSARGNWRDALRARAARGGQETLARLQLRSPLDGRADGDAD